MIHRLFFLMNSRKDRDKEDYWSEVKKLIKNDPSIINCQDSNGDTLLHQAMYENEFPEISEVIDYLIAQGINLEISNGNGLTALHEAAFNASLELVRKLVVAGANVKAINQHGSTPIHKVVSNTWFPDIRNFNNGQLIIKLLIKHGADINAKDQFCGTPLHMTDYWEAPDTPMAEFLKSMGADPNIPGGRWVKNGSVSQWINVNGSEAIKMDSRGGIPCNI